VLSCWEKREGQTCRRERIEKRRWEFRPDRNFNIAPLWSSKDKAM
jgi:hypothetical protein